MMHFEVNNYLGEWPFSEKVKMSVLECVDFDGKHYYTVFDPRKQEPLLEETVALQVRCETVGEVRALLNEIMRQALDEYCDWLADRGENAP